MTVFIVDLEPVPTRYTGQWKSHVPELLRKAGMNVIVVDGPSNIPEATTPGAFLNFGGTNVYKAGQVSKMGRLFCDGLVQDGDYFLFTDAWHPGIINLKYMAELLQIKVKIGALWHAGSYDPADFLGRLIGDEPWVRHAEKSFFHAIDHNYFATSFHIDMFIENLLGETLRDGRMHYIPPQKMVRTGWPMEYMRDTLAPWRGMKKRDLILFPHRIAPEKQVEIFRDLAETLPQFEWVVCQDKQLTKDQYHAMLGEAKIVFSCSLQETLGIGCYEGAELGAIPLVPDRLSYSEMYPTEYLYPPEWTESFASYLKYKDKLVQLIIAMVEDHESYGKITQSCADDLRAIFFSADNMVNLIRNNTK